QQLLHSVLASDRCRENNDTTTQSKVFVRIQCRWAETRSRSDGTGDFQDETLPGHVRVASGDFTYTTQTITQSLGVHVEALGGGRGRAGPEVGTHSVQQMGVVFQQQRAQHGRADLLGGGRTVVGQGQHTRIGLVQQTVGVVGV